MFYDYPLYEEILDVKLISYTQPSDELISELGEEWDGSLSDLIAYCARVSNPESRMSSLGSEKLIKFLVDNKHWSPLEMVDVTLKIKTCRDISHQAIRHISFRPQEFSQRYSNIHEKGEGFCLREARMQDHKNRQNSIESSDETLKAEWLQIQRELIDHAEEAYKWAIEQGIAKECARVVLPEGLTTTTMFFKGSIRSWLHYIELRGGNGTQKEHMMIAKECAKVIASVFPVDKIIG